LILCLLANLYPILTFDVAGNSQSNHILTGVLALIWMGYWPVALLVFFCAVAAPVLYFAAVWYVAGACCLNVRWPMAGHVARWAEWIEPWSLVPVFAIACVVSVVKLDMLGSVAWDKGIFWIALLAVCSFGLSQVFDREYVAKRLGAGQ
jgi:paraquat-inducible protein A